MGKKDTEKKDKYKKQPVALGIDEIELLDIVCVSCEKQNKLTEGEFHCKLCGVLCEPCADKHQKTPKTIGHWAKKIRRLRQENKQPHAFTSVKKCEEHPKRSIKGYCIEHGELVCKECKSERHYDCTVETLEVMSEGIKRDAQMVETRNELADIKRRTKKAEKRKRKEVIRMAEQAEEFEQYLRKVKEKIMTMFDNMLVAILREKDEFCKAESQLINKDVEKCLSMVPFLDVASKLLDDVYRDGNEVNMWVALKKAEGLISYYDERISAIENDKVNVKFEFLPNTHLAALLEAPENIGKMKISSSRLHGQDKKVTTQLDSDSPTATKKSKLLPWTKGELSERDPFRYKRIDSKSVQTPLPAMSVRDGFTKNAGSTKGSTSGGPTLKSQTKTARSKHDLIDEPKPKKAKEKMFGPNKAVKLTYIGRKEIQLPTDADVCCVTGSAFLPNGRLVLVDNHNKTLKLFDGEYEFLSVLNLEERPWNVAHCYKTVVAVSYPYDNSLEVITTGLEMTVDRKIQTDRPCRGMAYHKREQWLYIACGEGTDAQIQAFSLDGFLRKVIIPKQGVFHEPCYVAMTTDCSKLFVADLDNGVIGFNTKSGDMICQYKDPKIKRYWDITLDSEGRAYVVTTDPDCIYSLMGDHNGQLITEFRVGNKPCSVSYNPVKKTLVVSRWKSEDVEVLSFV